MGVRHVIAEISYDPEAVDDKEWVIDINELGKGMLATLTDFELEVCAAEIGIRVRNRFRLSPSPSGGNKLEQQSDPICPKCGGRQGYPNSLTHHNAIRPCWCPKSLNP